METLLRAWKPAEAERFHAWIAIVFWCVLSALLVALEAGPIAGVVVVLPCVLLAPGLVVVLLLRLRGLALTLTVVLLVGLALGVLVPAVFLYTGAWSPLGAFAVIAAGTVLGASAGAIVDVRRSHKGKGTRVPTSRGGGLAPGEFVVRHQGAGNTDDAVAPTQVAARKPPAAKLLVIEVAGAVRHPGLYRLPTGSRIDDAIAAAGGPTTAALLDTLDLLASIADGEQLVVPAHGAADAAATASSGGGGISPIPPVDLRSATLEQLEAMPGVGPSTAQKILELRQAVDDAIAIASGRTAKTRLDTADLAPPIADGEDVLIPARGAARAAAAAGSSAAGSSSPTPPVDLNTATLKQLEALPGVGPLTAQKILEYREAHGPFRSVTEIQDVPGIGPAEMAKLKGLVIT